MGTFFGVLFLKLCADPNSWIIVNRKRTDRSIFKSFVEMGYLDHYPELREELNLIMNERYEGQEE